MRAMAKKETMQRILVVIPTSTFTQRQLLEGLLAYAHEKTGASWQLHLDLHDLNRQHLKDLKTWNCRGIIAYILNDRQRRDFIATRLPAVFIEPTLSAPHRTTPRNVVTFVNDHAEEGRTAADYFLKRHYRSFAYIGTAKPTFWSKERENGFAERLAEDGFVPSVYPTPSPKEQNDFAMESHRLTRWLKHLPKPTALFCVHDRRAQQVIATAASAGVKVPDELAVLGVDNDELLCEMTVPAISSIPVGDRERGRNVGEAMDALISRRTTDRVVMSRHKAVITRRSTDTQAISDVFVARAVAYATAHIKSHPTISELATAAGCSTTILSRRTKAVFGNSIGREIARLRLDAAISMLCGTNRTVDEIATSCGFCGASHLGLRIKAATGKTPKEFRS